jgi:hypothetical protein
MKQKLDKVARDASRDFRRTFQGPLAAARERFMKMAETLAKDADAATLNWQASSLAAVLQDRKGGEHFSRINREIAADRAKAFGRQGGKARMVKMTGAQRKTVAKKAAAARWKKSARKAA